jgi:hypothetical protein
MSTRQQDNRSTLLKQELTKWEAFNRLQGNPDYQTFLKPLLQSAFNNIWPDPAEDNFEKKYVIQYARAKAYKEIHDLLETSEAMIKNIRTQVSQPDKNYEI